MDSANPLVEALPPATDYLTYLTILEYQLTRQRLPLLHELLQDEKLTTNIGWDLVKLLLPMLPASTECLQDIARLGNPREVILCVSEALMALQPDDDDDEGSSTVKRRRLPAHILRFNCLLGMLSVLHRRIETKSPSRFMATSLQAALEAYTSMPTDETTLALLEFLRDVAPSKRPTPPPRANSDLSVLRMAQASAPDPEAEVTVPSPAADNETALVLKFIQFGLIELVKAYLLSFSSPLDPGMSSAARMLEHLHPELRLPDQSQTEAFTTTKELKERDMIMGKILALSRDVGIDSNDLLSIVSKSPINQPQPLDFDDPPKSIDEIPLESHGSLLLLAARAAGAKLFAAASPMRQLPVFPDLAVIFDNFLGKNESLEEVAFEQPQALIDSLLALTVNAMQEPIVTPTNETEFKDFVLSLTSLSARQSYSLVRQIPGTIVRSHPSETTRFKLIRTALEDEKLLFSRDSAISWLRDELVGESTKSTDSIFHDPLHFWAIFPLLFIATRDLSTTNLFESWTRLTQTHGPYLHSALSLYYLLLSSPALRDSLHLEKTILFFRTQVLSPLRTQFRAFEDDVIASGGDGVIQAVVGEEVCQAGLARSAGLIGLTLDQIEELSNDIYGTDDADLKTYSEVEAAKVAEIRSESQSWN
ncbi:hypothetical protein N7495_006352 [Penicillium taxi]|uniref:uncharacterized protein n=1 Tax=Penicillium taxi TaxID=168475 RepID=UPI0025456660|nr:uncharacterized protein N7495_006352 [Penicillium taxi]KAJ5894661.1 hypothetical protein N7495_006352 [Penicillium taxi]